ncbi:hypothetical protein STPH2_7544 [Streptomyces sp. KO7888]|uniref:hypothetical protein n=1 Tax=unclassified Streptomyces TaxID=2593676 RepID=UPI0013F5BD70|nr:hypothetical protein [Streptomyces sp. KO7888]NHI12171.1 hypothetical protein [Streptomyces sp. KO7888]
MYGADEDEQGTRERQLRELLERAVPSLPAPADRMRRVHRRVRARRRRRAAWAAGVACGTVIALLYGSPVVQPLRSQVAAQSPHSHRTHLADGALSLDLPNGWHAREPADRSATVGVYVANRTLSAASCPIVIDTDDYRCPPLTGLAEGEALIFFRHAEVTEAFDSDTALEPSPYPRPGKGCRTLGGDQEWVGAGSVFLLGSDRTEKFPLVRVCLRDASDTTLAEVKAIIDSAAYDDTTSTEPRGAADGRDLRR